MPSRMVFAKGSSSSVSTAADCAGLSSATQSDRIRSARSGAATYGPSPKRVASAVGLTVDLALSRIVIAGFFFLKGGLDDADQRRRLGNSFPPPSAAHPAPPRKASRHLPAPG